MDYITILGKMEGVAREAGLLSLDYFNRRIELDVNIKGPADFLCVADEDVESLIRDSLKRVNPDWGFRGEEIGFIEGHDSTCEWVVDPIDGTTNFLSGLHYTISIALRHNNETVCGALYNPVADEMFTAIAGQGAYLNGELIEVREKQDISHFVVGTGIPTSNLRFSNDYYERLEAVREQIGAIRIIGSCANSLAHVACGRLDGYFEGPMNLYDYAVGVLLVREAGGVVTDFWGRGKEYWENNSTLVVGHRYCQEFLLITTQQAEGSDD